MELNRLRHRPRARRPWGRPGARRDGPVDRHRVGDVAVSRPSGYPHSPNWSGSTRLDTGDVAAWAGAVPRGADSAPETGDGSRTSGSLVMRRLRSEGFGPVSLVAALFRVAPPLAADWS